MPSRHARAALAARVLAPLLLLALFACTASSGNLEPRFVAVHNALAALGLAQVGPIHQGLLGPGREARVPMELGAGCSTVVAVGGEGVLDVDAVLLDAQGKAVAHDTTVEPQAVLHLCPDAAGSYTLVIKVAAGAGPWIAAGWQGATPNAGTPGAPVDTTAGQVAGTCETPVPLSAGTVNGTTARGQDGNSGSCERSDAREIVYELDVTRRERVVLDVEAHFDSVLYVRKDACTDPDAEVDCNDDAPNSGRNRSHIEHVLEPGRYFVFVDGYNQEVGNYKLTVSTSEVVSLGDRCRKAPALVAGVVATGSTAGAADDARASCGGGAEGPDAPWRVDLATRSRVRVVEHSDDVQPVVYARHACADEQSELACGESGAAPGDATFTGILDPGAYAVFADAREGGAPGGYSLLLETTPVEGAGVPGDGCGDALPLPPSMASVQGDTFAARDDVAGSCGGGGAADVVYRVDVPRRSRLLAKLEGEEGTHVLSAWRRCGDPGSEVGCGKTLDAVVSAGTYFVVVDGASADALGRYTLVWGLQDVSGQAAACAAAPLLSAGKPVSGTTAGAGDRFASSCAGETGPTTSGPDRVFRVVVPSRETVSVSLTTSGFDAALSLRRACADAPGLGSELDCQIHQESGRLTTLQRTLEAGTYWVVVDGQTPGDQGAFSLDVRTITARR